MEIYPRLITTTPFENGKIISYGLIVYALNTGNCIIVQRKHSIEFLLLMTGNYRPSLIPLLLPNMTTEEQEIIQSIRKPDDFDTIFHSIGFEENLDYARLRFFEAKLPIISQSQPLKWTWPKGRLNIDENGLVCAKREFEEEVEMVLPEAIYISPNYFTEVLHTLTCKVIETRCWFYVIPEELPLPPLNNHKEVNDRQWVPLQEALIKVNQPDLMPDLQQCLND